MRSIHNAIALFSTPWLFAIGASAQGFVGLTHSTPSLVQQDPATCVTQSCPVLSHQSRVSTYAGATAYDGRRGATWVSNGTELDLILPPRGGCAPVCTRQAVPFPSGSTGLSCTGMTYLEAGALTASGGPGPRGRLFFSYTSSEFGWADTDGCTLSNYQSCNVSWLSNFPVGGLACDDIRRWLFIGAAHSSAGALIYIVRADTPCAAVSRVAIRVNASVCASTPSLNAITGLAYDSCTETLYATDGKTVIWGTLVVSAAGRGTWTHQGCCAAPGEEYTGLSLVPPRQSTVGTSCTAGSCSSCAGMIAGTTGDALLGNGSFSLNLDGAPSNAAIYALAVGIGPCAAPGIGLGFCESVFVSLAPPGPLVLLLPGPAVAPSCNGFLHVPAAIPIDQALCNQEISFQWLVNCGAGTGHGVSNCVTFTVR